MRIEDIAWAAWTPRERATLLFVIRDGQVLLIRKKRGLGAGKINGPGGRIDPGETPQQCAIREVQEELCVTPENVSPAGELSFQFIDGYALHVYVFTATACAGTPQDTAEAAPLWTPLNAIPFGEMWADDHLWFPMMLSREPFYGRFVFDGDKLLDHRLNSTAC